jgi:hypothetical protein
MLDLVALAFQCDRTRVVTYMLGEVESWNPFTFLGIRTPTSGVDQGHHGASHHGGRAEMLAAIERIDGRAGGALATGRHVNAGGRPLADLHLGVLRAVGIERPSFVNSTGALPLG